MKESKMKERRWMCGCCDKYSSEHTPEEKKKCERVFLAWYYFCLHCNMRVRNCTCEKMKGFAESLLDINNEIKVDRIKGEIAIKIKQK